MKSKQEKKGKKIKENKEKKKAASWTKKIS